MTAPDPAVPRDDTSWDVSFLRVGALVTAFVTAVAAPLAGLLGGWDSALGVLAGAVVVTLFFSLSGLVIAWAGGHGDAFTLPAALGTFFVKMLVFVAVLRALPPDGPLDRLALAWAVIVGALLWGGVQARWVWTRQLYYVAPPAPPSHGSSAVPPAHPEKPTPQA
ncbi:hypothetical protein [Blastococcus sp. PRF04-17]|uniref:hypothetical protein n=1 Tax=Blastococcus sp. PRF04-17 TaxID=2933797 RepID=UPI001FF61491|nr:hypothetical protein [Blastococcus sp. PRF04-17]UOY01395.1 hypothetical protein MVA48_21020 [Blastococcus sp. PRF04-17]